jgi:hypothetical protein
MLKKAKKTKTAKKAKSKVKRKSATTHHDRKTRTLKSAA